MNIRNNEQRKAYVNDSMIRKSAAYWVSVELKKRKEGKNGVKIER